MQWSMTQSSNLREAQAVNTTLSSVATEEEYLNERVVRELYEAAEVQDIDRFVSLFTADGYFYDVSAGQKHYGKDIGKPVEIYAEAFPDMHRALDFVRPTGEIVLVELSLNGSHRGPLAVPGGSIAATGNTIHTPCCDVFRLENGKVKSFHCYTAATILFGQIGVLSNMSAAIVPA